MKKRIFYLVLLAFNSHIAFTQSYFQQEVNYTISVKLNDNEHSLTGFETIQYINNSPYSLNYLYFHLWPNAYKNNSTAFARQELENGNTEFHFASADERGFIDSLDFRVNGKPIGWELNKDTIDICRLLLNESLQPGDTIIISTPFFVKIPGCFSRLGHKGQAYQITQWYPKPAVYDRYGWHPMPYLDYGEFYSEYGSFDVSITLPRNYIVAATGNLMTPGELAWLNGKVSDTTAVHFFPASDKISKTIRYTEKNIHDFAWFADKRYRVLKGEVVLSDSRKVTTWAMFTAPQVELWRNAIEYINDAIKYYSAWYGNYPYNNCSAVYGALEAGGAMEYPTITVIGNTHNPVVLEDFIMHEVGHNWFYGILGFNERKYPFLDEGINTFSESRYLVTKYPDLKLYDFLIGNQWLAHILNADELPYGLKNEYVYLLSARKNLDQSLNLNSELYTPMNYGSMIYDKSALVLNYLMQYLGEKKFDTIMHKFFLEWQFKHPGPDDFQRIFEDNCKEDLSWFFDDLIAGTGKVDYAVKRIRNNQVLVRNSGQISSPVCLTSLQDGSVQHMSWYPGFDGKKWLDFPLQATDKVVLFGSVWLPEINRKNNMLRVHGLFKKTERPDINLFQIIEKPDRIQLGVFPAVGWNNYNKTMLGILLYSPLIPQQVLNYQIMPMFGLGNHEFAGLGRVSLNLYPNSSVFQAIMLSFNARRFGYGTGQHQNYHKAGGEMLVTFRNNVARSPLLKTLKFEISTSGTHLQSTNEAFMERYFITMDAGFENRKVLGPYKINLGVELNNDFVRSSLEINYRHALKYAPDAIAFRFYGSGFFNTKADFNPDLYGIRLSGASGINDYKYDHLFLGRFEDIKDVNRQMFLSQQFTMTQGGFASNSPFAVSDKWLVSGGLTLRVPWSPLYLFVNAGTYGGAGEDSWNLPEENQVTSELVAYEAGAMINLGNIIRIYFPIVTSKDISVVNHSLTDHYWQTIRYIIDFNAINPFHLKARLF